MSFEINSFEYNLGFFSNILMISFKAIITIYFAILLFKQKKDSGKLVFNFTMGTFILFLSLLFYRIFMFYFFFFLTNMDINKYYLPFPFFINSIALFILVLGNALCLLSIDKYVLDFKLKGIPSCILLSAAFLLVIFPNQLTLNIVSLVSPIALIIIMTIMIYVGIKNPSLRRATFLFSLGLLIYEISIYITSFWIQIAIENAFGTEGVVILFIIYLILKLSSYPLITYGVVSFKI